LIIGCNTAAANNNINNSSRSASYSENHDDDDNNIATFGDGETNTQVAMPITDQDQREANLAEKRALNDDIV